MKYLQISNEHNSIIMSIEISLLPQQPGYQMYFWYPYRVLARIENLPVQVQKNGCVKFVIATLAVHLHF